jgi:hypothetical protein
MSARYPTVSTLLFGAASLALYALLLTNSGLLIELAERTRNGESRFFLVPVSVAFVFSYIHGTFTGQFWDRIGVRPASRAAGAKTQ